MSHPPAEPAAPDLTAERARLMAQRQGALAALEQSAAAAAGDGGAHVFVRRFDAQARAAARAADDALAAGAPLPALGGLAVSVKDLLDVAGQPTTAGSRVLDGAKPASHDAPVVARVRRAGAALVGHTTMTEFAYSGVGLNPHVGTPANPATAALDPRPRIPGGSTSGGAVSVAIGAAHAALGSDTGGSLRIPAALTGLVGFKSTARLVSTEGAIPLSRTLDTIGAITRSVRDAVLVHAVLRDRAVALAGRPAHALRLALVRTTVLDGLDDVVAATWARAVSVLSAAGARIEEVDLPAFRPDAPDFAAATAQGGFAAAESWAWHRQLLADRGDHYDPRVALRIRRGADISAAAYLDMIDARSRWITSVEQALLGFDAALCPTVPIIAPPIADLATDDDRFFRDNALLLRNPSLVNLLDGCALSLPCHRPGEWPVGLMLWAPGGRDDALLDAAGAAESALRAGT